MSDRPDAPCEHSDTWTGYIEAGNLRTGAYCSTYTCSECAPVTREYVTTVTGHPASDIIPFPAERRYL
ncbi:hypothetical protein ACL02S_23240 [Nocardia sp. 004]|uniref:hypothetical protein n=1 Tax=Nocardia sp. 004 TaxID=3385978 RepID=UPI0039A1BFC5